MIRVLLAEDKHMVRGALVALLNLEPDIDVVAEVDTGAEILTSARKHSPDVAVIDVDLPVFDGLDAVAGIRETLPGVRTLMLTSLGRPGTLRHALAARVDGFLFKEAPPGQLAGAIRDVAAGRRVVGSQLSLAEWTPVRDAGPGDSGRYPEELPVSVAPQQIGATREPAPVAEIKVLGPLTADVNGRSVRPTAGKPRQILALLALHAGKVVPAATLIEELWAQRPPRSVRTTLQTYILQLRRLIDDALAADGVGVAKEVLVTEFNGYLLDVPRDAVDVHGYERYAAAGQTALESGDCESASRLLGKALAVWRGPALADVRAGSALGVEAVRLEESRVTVLERRIDADLRLGRHHALLSELSVLTAQHPMHENLCAHHMIALFRSGRRWQALEAFTCLRTALVAELGVEPSARLQQLQRAVLNSDPRLDFTATQRLHRTLT